MANGEMKSAYEALLESTAWDKTTDLPLVPMHLNPHIYCAYAVRILESFDVSLTRVNQEGAWTIRDHYEKTFLKACESEPGYLTTYPNGGTASHDDLHGAGFLNGPFAIKCVDYLTHHDGSYTSGQDSEAHNQYRFLFFLPAMKAHAGFRLGLLTQLQFIVALLTNLWFTKEGSTDGQLLLWLSFPEMRRAKVVSAFIDYWSDTWTKRGQTPRVIFQKFYLTECPWFGEWAREDWE